MAGLQEHDDDAPARCFVCGGIAVGPCARCRRPVCGDCCELTSGGARTYAFCLGCRKAGGASLASGWWSVVLWMSVPVVLAAVVVLLLAWRRG
jgi:hypothetical protein